MNVQPRFDYGDEVRVVRTLRNDGTFPGIDIGVVLVRQGAVGHVRNVGTFLQEQIIYAVHFTDIDRMVGCREEELIRATDAWTPTQFLFGDKVRTRVPLAVRGEVVAAVESIGEVIKVLRDDPSRICYHVLLNDRIFQIPESALTLADREAENTHAG